jgi:Cdc6-like AAA superfamily ATPase
MYFDPADQRKWPYFFLTGSAGTGKTHVTKMITNMLETRRNKYLLMAPTGVAAQHIGGKTIHSALRISANTNSFLTLAHTNRDFLDELRQYQTIIIDEISMVSDTLFAFLSDMFGRIHNNHLPFGGINVLVVGDLAQLPPIKDNQVFHSPVWRLFYPLFLTTSHRQGDDQTFFNMLQKVRVGDIDDHTWHLLQMKYISDQTQRHDVFTTTHITGLRATALEHNNMVCSNLPEPDADQIYSLTSTSTDFVQGEKWPSSLADRLFSSQNQPRLKSANSCGFPSHVSKQHSI